MSVKTFVITLPKPLSPGAQVKGVVTPEMLNELNTSGKTSTMDLAGNVLQFVKEEPAQIIEVNENVKQVRKRQRLDHLSYEEKLMRRKLKNRVAAQTARDRKKLRMDELELQVSQMSDQISQLSSLVQKLTQHNQQLEQENTLLRNRPSPCTCNISSATTPKPMNLRHTNTVQERKTPVCSVTEKSAALPQPRAVTLQAVALWVLFLRIALLCHLAMGKIMVSSQHKGESCQTKLHSEFPSKEVTLKWMLLPQPPWKLLSRILY